MFQQEPAVRSANETIRCIANTSHGDALEAQEKSDDGNFQLPHTAGDSLPSQSPSSIMAAINEALWRHLTVSDLRSMSAKLMAEMQERCQSDPQTMLPSFTNRLPTGMESGTFLCFDVGGSTLRAALVRLHEFQPTAEVVAMQTASITPELKNADGASFFRWIAKDVAPLAKELGIVTQGQQPVLKTAITWSFPFIQETVNRATIVACGKGFRTFDELVGRNLDTVLCDAFRDEGVSISIAAMVNDTVASLLAGNHGEPTMTMSVVLGTGLNAAAAIPTSTMGSRKLNAEILESVATDGPIAGHVLVNTELSILGDDIFPRTSWDDKVRESITGGVIAQPLEYICGGYYVGEIARVILIWSHASGFLLPQPMVEQLMDPFALDAATLAIFESDSTQDLSISAQALTKRYGPLGVGCPNFGQLSMMKAVAQAVSRRAAGYMAAAIHAMSGLASQRAWEHNTSVVGVSGAMFEKYPGFTATCEAMLNSLAQDQGVSKGDRKDRPGHFVLKKVAHGSVVGSAIAAALSSR